MVTEWVHAICGHSKLYVPYILGKPPKVGINVSPLCCFCEVPKLADFLLSAFLMPTQELGLLSCCKPSSMPPSQEPLS
jgi:hypothetical protein